MTEPSSDPRDGRFRTEGVSQNLKQLSLRGGAVSLGGQLARFMMALGSTAVLARVLSPGDFGLLAMVGVVTAFVNVFSDAGLAAASVQRAELSHAQASTMFWVNVVVGVLLAGVTAAIAPLAAAFFGDERILPVTLALATTYPVVALSIQHLALLRRQMRFGALTAVNLSSQATSIVAGICAALAGAGYWALVVMLLVSPAVQTAGLWIAARWKPGRPVRGSGARSLVAFGSHVTAFQCVNYAIRQGDDLLVGWAWGTTALGLYRKAYELLMLPLRLVTEPITIVAVPALSRLQDDPERYRSYYYRAVEMVVILSLPIPVLFLVDPSAVVLTIFGEQWSEAAIILAVLAPAAMISTTNLASGWAYMSLGHASRQLRSAILVAPVFLAAFAIGLQWGAVGVAAGFSIACLAIRLPELLWCYHGTFLSIRELGRRLWRPAVAAVFAGLALFGVGLLMDGRLPPVATLSIDLVVLGAAYLAAWTILPGGRVILSGILQLVGELKSGGKGAQA